MSMSVRELTAFAVFICLHSVAHGEVKLRSVGFSKPLTSNFALKNHILRTVHRVRSPTRCQANCLREPECVTVNYSEESHICELNDGYKTDFPEDVTEDSGWRYYEMDSTVVEKTINAPVGLLN